MASSSSIRTLRARTVPLRPTADDARLQQLEQSWQQFPGRAPGGTGLTGLLPNDSRGYSDLLNEQTEYANLLRRQQGEGPLTVRASYPRGGGSFGTAGDALEDVATSMPWWTPPPSQAQATPTPPPGPPAPPAPPLPPPTGARSAQGRRSALAAPPSSSAALGSLAAQTGAPGAVTRYANAYPGAPVTAEAFLPSDVADDLETPETAIGMLQQRLKPRTAT